MPKSTASAIKLPLTPSPRVQSERSRVPIPASVPAATWGMGPTAMSASCRPLGGCRQTASRVGSAAGRRRSRNRRARSRRTPPSAGRSRTRRRSHPRRQQRLRSRCGLCTTIGGCSPDAAERVRCVACVTQDVDVAETGIAHRCLVHVHPPSCVCQRRNMQEVGCDLRQHGVQLSERCSAEICVPSALVWVNCPVIAVPSTRGRRSWKRRSMP